MDFLPFVNVVGVCFSEAIWCDLANGEDAGNAEKRLLLDGGSAPMPPGFIAFGPE